MKRINIINEFTNEIFTAQFENDEKLLEWKEECILNNVWGLPERILESVPVELESRIISQETKTREVFEEIVEYTEYTVKADYVIEIIDLEQDADYLLQECYRKRRAEYPDMADYMDGLVKGDEVQKQKYINDCLAVKAKYPKPL
jgi:hypothetical protein